MIQHDISSIFPLDGQQITETMESIRIYPFYGVSGPDLVCGGRPSDLAKAAWPDIPTVWLTSPRGCVMFCQSQVKLYHPWRIHGAAIYGNMM